MLTAVTQNSPETFLKYRRFERRKGVRSLLVPLGVLCATGIGFLFFVPAFGVILLLVTVLALPTYVLSKTVSAKMTVKKKGAFFRTANKYEFGETELLVTSATSGAKKAYQTRLTYPELYQVVETPDAFYLYLRPNSCLLCPKEDFTEGTAEECSALLAEKLPPKKFQRITWGRKK